MGALLIAALGVLPADPVGAEDCVRVGRPKLGVKYAFHFTDPVGTISTSTTEYLAVSDTWLRVRLTHTGAFGTIETVNDSTLRVEDDLVVVEKMAAMEAAGITTVKSPADMGATVARVLGRGR